MNYFEGMQESNPYNDLLGNLCCIILIEKLIILDEFEKILPIHQLRYYIYVGLGLNAFLELQEEWMRNDLHDAAFVTQ